MIDICQRIDEARADLAQIFNRQPRLIQLTLLQFHENNALNKLFEFLTLRRMHRARPCFDRIDEHENRGLLGSWAHSGIAEERLFELLRIAALQTLVPKIFDDARAVMRVRELNNGFRNAAPTQDADAFNDVRHDRVCADIRLQLFVRAVFAVL